MADTKDTERPDLLALADDLAHMARHAVSDRGRLQLAADVLRAQAERAAPQPADAADGWARVPRDPTLAMSKAAADAWLDCGSRLCLNKAAAAVRVGIAAAPPGQDASKGGAQHD